MKPVLRQAARDLRGAQATAREQRALDEEPEDALELLLDLRALQDPQRARHSLEGGQAAAIRV
jgi:hypothetical protein